LAVRKVPAGLNIVNSVPFSFLLHSMHIYEGVRYGAEFLEKAYESLKLGERVVKVSKRFLSFQNRTRLYTFLVGSDALGCRDTGGSPTRISLMQIGGNVLKKNFLEIKY
jgi:hypothetical protein